MFYVPHSLTLNPCQTAVELLSGEASLTHSSFVKHTVAGEHPISLKHGGRKRSSTDHDEDSRVKASKENQSDESGSL